MNLKCKRCNNRFLTSIRPSITMLLKEEYFTAHIDGFDKGEICLSTENDLKHILIVDINEAEIIDIDDRKYKSTKDEIIGYKGLYVQNGILDAGGYIYELGIPYEEEKRKPFETDYQDVYSHFCTSIEDVFK